jgi:hypothetical protein
MNPFSQLQCFFFFPYSPLKLGTTNYFPIAFSIFFFPHPLIYMMTHPISLTIPAYVQKKPPREPSPMPCRSRVQISWTTFLFNHPSCLCNLIAAYSGIKSFKAVRACGKNEED